MKTKYFILAAIVGMTFASCSNDEYIGDTSPTLGENGGDDAIQFGYKVANVTRANITGAEAAGKLGNAFKTYGVKQNRTTATNYDKVFIDYTVKYSTTQAGNDEYNNGWYYVGGEAPSTQSIKYWDYASADYHFVAGSPVANFTYALDGTTGDIKTATVSGLGGHLNHTTKNSSVTPDAVYIADPIVVAKANYKQEVAFTFRSMQTKVRVGIYETIPGYKITNIQFYNNDATPVASNYITLNSATDDYFQGTTSTTGTITYNWATPAYTFAYGTVTSGKYWEGGQFTSGVPAISSAETTISNLYGTADDIGTTGFFVVMPTPSATAAAPLTLTCNYTLTSLDGSGETIEVKKAKATIPAAYTKWAANTAYTYLFKISDNTNGTTGTPDTDPEGLYPITFDAVVINEADAGQNVGTETTISTPSITVYQNGDVVANGITFNTNAITVTVMNGTSDVTASADLKYVELASYNYGTDYEKLGASGTATTWTSGTPTLTSGKTYVLKAGVDTDATPGADTFAYFVLVVSPAENGPANP